MYKMKTISVAVCLLGFCAAPAFAMDQAHLEAAKRYAETAQIEDILNRSLEELGRNPQLHMTQDEIAAVKASVDVAECKKVTIMAMADTFTTQELNAATAFYSSPEGRSIMQKMPVYTARIMPYLQKVTINAMKVYLDKHPELLKDNQGE